MMDLAVNSLSILTAVFVTNRLATRFGLAITLALVPLLLVFGWLAVAIAPGGDPPNIPGLETVFGELIDNKVQF